MAIETHVHDGGAWRKAKQIHVHDGTAWRDCKEAWCHDGSAWRKVFQKSKWSDITGSLSVGGNLHSIAKGNGVVYVGTSTGYVWELNGSTWTGTNLGGGAVFVCASSTKVFAVTASNIVYFKPHGGSWSAGMYVANFGPMILASADDVYIPGTDVVQTTASCTSYSSLDEYTYYGHPDDYYTLWAGATGQLAMHSGKLIAALEYYDSRSPTYQKNVSVRDPTWAFQSTALSDSTGGWRDVCSDGTNIFAAEAGSYCAYTVGSTTKTAIPWDDASYATIGFTYGEPFAMCASTMVVASVQAAAYPCGYVPAKYVSGEWVQLDEVPGGLELLGS